MIKTRVPGYGWELVTSVVFGDFFFFFFWRGNSAIKRFPALVRPAAAQPPSPEFAGELRGARAAQKSYIRLIFSLHSPSNINIGATQLVSSQAGFLHQGGRPLIFNVSRLDDHQEQRSTTRRPSPPRCCDFNAPSKQTELTRLRYQFCQSRPESHSK